MVLVIDSVVGIEMVMGFVVYDIVFVVVDGVLVVMVVGFILV